VPGGRLTYEEREEIALLHYRGNGVRQIARAIGRDPSTISRELRRNISPSPRRYRAFPAHIRARERARRSKPRKLVPGAPVRAAVAGMLRKNYSPGQIAFAQRWLHRLHLPFGTKDHDAGYWREISMRQVEISRTIVFEAPRHARGFFEALVADNLDIGRPHNVEIIFGRKIRRDTKGVFRTAIDRRDNGGVLVNVFYKHSRIKQYLKDGRAMRIETVVNAPRDLGCNARLPNLDELQARARAANRRILEAERAGQGTVLASPAFERVAHPTADAEGRRTPALQIRRSSGHGPGRRLVPDTARRNRLHQQEPARLDRRAARQRLHTRADDL
jgi:hypothetical protein